MIKFDEQYYLFTYQDVKKAGIAALEHWLIWGKKEDRQAKFSKPACVDLHPTLPIEKGKVSVVLSVQDRNQVNSDQLVRAVNSVLMQSYKNFELIFIGPKDMVPLNNKIKVIETHEWFAARRYNLGILEARGEFIAFILPNCEWTPDCLKTLVEGIRNSSMVSAKIEFINPPHHPVEFGEPLGPKCYSYVNLSICSVLLRREIFNTIGCFDDSPEFLRCEDQEMWARICYKKFNTRFIPVIVGKQYNDLKANDVLTIDRKIVYASLILKYDCFDEVYYLENNQDAKNAVNSGMFVSGLHHFLKYGYKEFRLIHRPAIRSIKLG